MNNFFLKIGKQVWVKRVTVNFLLRNLLSMHTHTHTYTHTQLRKDKEENIGDVEFTINEKDSCFLEGKL